MDSFEESSKCHPDTTGAGEVKSCKGLCKVCHENPCYVEDEAIISLNLVAQEPEKLNIPEVCHTKVEVENHSSAVVVEANNTLGCGLVKKKEHDELITAKECTCSKSILPPITATDHITNQEVITVDDNKSNTSESAEQQERGGIIIFIIIYQIKFFFLLKIKIVLFFFSQDGATI